MVVYKHCSFVLGQVIRYGYELGNSSVCMVSKLPVHTGIITTRGEAEWLFISVALLFLGMSLGMVTS